MARIGLVAGHGNLPMVFARAAKEKGETVIAFALKGVTDESLAASVDKIHWFEWGHLEKALLFLVTERIRRIAMLGKVKKEILFKGDEKLDEKARSLLVKKDRKDYSILTEVSKILKPLGIEIIDPSPYLKELIPSKGTLTRRAPTDDEWDDIHYGRDVAKELSKYDIGQTIVIKDKTVIACEALEGTDETIKRSGQYAKVGFTVVKVARPDQDMRFDIPLVGHDTVKALCEAGGKVLAIEADKTLLMDREEVIRYADEKGLSITVI